MLVPVERASAVVAEYLSRELDKVSDPLKRFGYKFAVGAMATNTDALRQKAAVLGVLSADGCIDTDAVRNGFTASFSSGNTVHLIGMTFSQADADEIVRRLEQ